MKPYFSYTPRHWEFGIGFYAGQYHVNAITDKLSRHPSEISIMIGPFSFCIEFGVYIEVE